MSSSCLGPSIRLWPFSFPPSCICRPRRALSIMSRWFPWQSPALLELLATQTGPYQLTTSMTSFSSYWGQNVIAGERAFPSLSSYIFPFLPLLPSSPAVLLLSSFLRFPIYLPPFCFTILPILSFFLAISVGKLSECFLLKRVICLWEEEGLWVQI